MIVTISCVLVLWDNLLIASGAVRAASTLHNKMLAAVIHAPLVFFDTELTVSE